MTRGESPTPPPVRPGLVRGTHARRRARPALILSSPPQAGVSKDGVDYRVSGDQPGPASSVGRSPV